MRGTVVARRAGSTRRSGGAARPPARRAVAASRTLRVTCVVWAAWARPWRRSSAGRTPPRWGSPSGWPPRSCSSVGCSRPTSPSAPPTTTGRPRASTSTRSAPGCSPSSSSRRASPSTWPSRASHRAARSWTLATLALGVDLPRQPGRGVGEQRLQRLDQRLRQHVLRADGVPRPARRRRPRAPRHRRAARPRRARRRCPACARPPPGTGTSSTSCGSASSPPSS